VWTIRVPTALAQELRKGAAGRDMPLSACGAAILANGIGKPELAPLPPLKDEEAQGQLNLKTA
jgi:hypothetical protein